MVSSIKTEATDMIGALERTVDRATSNANEAIDRASNGVRPAVDHIVDGAHKAVQTLSAAASRAAETLDARSRQLRDAQLRLAESCCGYVREKPMTSLGIAMTAGFLLGWLFKSRRS